MRKTIIAAVVLLTSVLPGLTGQTPSRSEEKQDLAMAESAILSRLAIMSSSPDVCTEQPAVCISADGIELGTALIAARSSPQSLRSFARLHRFILDASYGETFDQLLCEKSRGIEKYVAKLDPVELNHQCIKEFDAAVKANPKELAHAKVDQVCSSVKDIRSHIHETLEMVRIPPASCEP
jgi:hypothetical protein